MTPELLKYLCEPLAKSPLILVDAITSKDGMTQSGFLLALSGKRYPIVKGIPRFVGFAPDLSVKSFGDDWNYFNFTDFKINWLKHTVAITFGSVDAFKDITIILSEQYLCVAL